VKGDGGARGIRGDQQTDGPRKGGKRVCRQFVFKGQVIMALRRGEKLALPFPPPGPG